MSRYPIRNLNWRTDSPIWPHSEMWRQLMAEAEAEADRLTRRKVRKLTSTFPV